MSCCVAVDREKDWILAGFAGLRVVFVEGIISGFDAK
jgi:hypothetical protein